MSSKQTWRRTRAVFAILSQRRDCRRQNSCRRAACLRTKRQIACAGLGSGEFFMARDRKLSDAKHALKELWPSQRSEQSVELLKALHILTRDGALNADSRRKLKQVLHLTQLLRPFLEEMLAESEDPVLADLGAGKSYLGFILYDLILGPAGKGRVFGVETRSELVESS